jgi:predicted signal transduction protein with EAL and GGDEF domain
MNLMALSGQVDFTAIAIVGLSCMVPVVIMLLRHQREMAKIIHGNHQQNQPTQRDDANESRLARIEAQLEMLISKQSTPAVQDETRIGDRISQGD